MDALKGISASIGIDKSGAVSNDAALTDNELWTMLQSIAVECKFAYDAAPNGPSAAQYRRDYCFALALLRLTDRVAFLAAHKDAEHNG